MPTTPGITKPQAPISHGVQALAAPATAPCPRPLASPSLKLRFPMGSKPSQLQRLPHAHDPWHHQASSSDFPWGPSPRSSSDCPMPTTPGITKPQAPISHGVQALAAPATAPCPRPLASPSLKLRFPMGSKPSQLQRLPHAHDPWHHQASSSDFPWGPSPRSSSDCPMPTTPGIPDPRAVDSRRVQALTGPAPVPCPRPLASPVLGLSIPSGSEPRQFRRLRHTRRPWRFPTS